MSCKEMRELLSDYLDGELADPEEANVAQHLTVCARCSGELTTFSAISKAAKSLPSHTAPSEVWEALERDLDRANPVDIASPGPRRAWSPWRILAIAATLLLAVGIFTWIARPFAGHHHQMAHFGRFMEAFPGDPEGAQLALVTSYSGRAATAKELAETLKYTPVGLGRAPAGYTTHQSYLLNMPCCRCSQAVFRRDQGGFVALFEHDTSEKPDVFGDCPCVMTKCNGVPCTLVQTENHIAAACEVGGRHFTIVGARNVEEIQTFVAWLEGETQSQTTQI